jgi:hypothetical protein
MADPTTELAKEFLEINGYIVRKETKFYKKIKNKRPFGTASDIDIIATRSRPIKIGDIKLKENIVAEAKNWEVDSKGTIDDIYNDKFKRVENFKVSWVQLKNFISSKRFDKILFCLATTEKVYKYALKEYGIKIITSGFIIKNIANFVKTSERNWSYYPEWYHYNTIRTILLYLYYTKYKDKLTLEDLVWIDPKKNRQYTNRFVKLNSKFLEEMVYRESSGDIIINIIKRLSKEYPWWFKKQLKTNKSFWNYLTKN